MRTSIQAATACEALIGRPVRNIASLTAAAVLGLIYVNVHTVASILGARSAVRSLLAWSQCDNCHRPDPYAGTVLTKPCSPEKQA